MRIRNMIQVPETDKPRHLHGAYKRGYLDYFCGSSIKGIPYYRRVWEVDNLGPMRKAYNEGWERAKEDCGSGELRLIERS